MNAISFTGSVDDRRARSRRPAPRAGAKFQLEMGGKNPLVVLDDADLDAAVDAAIDGAFFSDRPALHGVVAARSCTEGIHDAFVDKTVPAMKALGRQRAEGRHDIGPVVDESQLEQDLKYIDIGRKEGAKLAWGGELLNRDTKGHYLSPALFTDTTNDMRINREEIFGPVASVIQVEGLRRGAGRRQRHAFGLSSGIFTTSLKHADALQASTRRPAW